MSDRLFMAMPNEFANERQGEVSGEIRLKYRVKSK